MFFFVANKFDLIWFEKFRNNFDVLFYTRTTSKIRNKKSFSGWKALQLLQNFLANGNV